MLVAQQKIKTKEEFERKHNEEVKHCTHFFLGTVHIFIKFTLLTTLNAEIVALRQCRGSHARNYMTFIRKIGAYEILREAR